MTELIHTRAIIHITNTAAEGYDWVAERSHYIGASEVAAVMGLSPYQTPVSVWASKLGIGERFEGNHLTRRGHVIEPYLCDEFSRETGHKVERPRFLLGHREINHFRTNLDGWIPELGAHLECKDSSWRSRDHWIALRDHGEVIPGTDVAGYWLQVQAAMSILGTASAWFAVDCAKELIFFDVQRDEEAIEAIEASVRGFWAAHIVTEDEPPAVNPGDLRILRDLYLEDHDETLDLSGDENLTALLDIYDNAATKAAAHKKQADAIKDEIEELIKASGAKVATHNGRKVQFQDGAKRLDGSALRKAHPDIAAAFMVEGSAQFRIYGAKL